MNNVIFNAYNDAIGYYNDLTKNNKDDMKQFINEDNYEQVKIFIEIQELLDEYKDYNGLLVVSENNGMGYTVKPYKEYKEN